MALDGPFHLADRIPVQARPVGIIGASDVSMRALNKANTEEAITVGHAFHITRLDWCYSTNAAWITRIRDQGWTYMGALLNQTTDRSTWRYKADGTWYIPSWFTWVDPANPSQSLPCYNDPLHESAYVASAKKYIDLGFTVFHKDDTEGNYADHSLKAGCCFCSDCTAKATAAGLDLSVSTVRKTFQRDSTLAFYQRTRAALEAYAGKPITLSGNLDLASPIAAACNGAILEIKVGDAVDPSWLRSKVLATRRLGKVQAYTAQDEWGVAKFRTGISMVYAAGSNLIVPWDQYLTFKSTRLFMDPKDLADLYGFIRGIAAYLDGYEDAAVAGYDFTATDFGTGAVAQVTGDAKVSAWLKAKPHDRRAPLVVHLTDADAAAPITLRLRTDALFAGAPFTAELLTPRPYDAALHQAAETAHDYSTLVQRQAVTATTETVWSVFSLPSGVAPWAVLVLTPVERRVGLQAQDAANRPLALEASLIPADATGVPSGDGLAFQPLRPDRDYQIAITGAVPGTSG